MKPFQTILLLVAVLPILGTVTWFGARFAVWATRALLASSRNMPTRAVAPWKELGGSMIETASHGSASLASGAPEPLFQTLRTTVHRDDRRWRLSIRFLFFNALQCTIGLDDIHAITYEKQHRPVGFAWNTTARADMVLSSDNSLLKEEEKRYDLPSGDGFEITLSLEVAVLASSWGHSLHNTRIGSARAIFGLLIDYYTTDSVPIQRYSLPSDCVYVFECDSDHAYLHAVNDSHVGQWEALVTRSSEPQKLQNQLRHILNVHHTFRRVPKP